MPYGYTRSSVPATSNAGISSQLWAEVLPGIRTRLNTREKVIALTFDACGSSNDGFDTRIINCLYRYQIPATLFISGRWIAKNPGLFYQLAQNPLFEIENHGVEHKPASVSGRSAYGIAGTRNEWELAYEVEQNARIIQSYTGRRPRFYRSGTAFYDPGAVNLIYRLGFQPVGFSVLGDAGATYSRSQVRQALLSADAGAITIMHMNHPERDAGNGLADALPELLSRGYRFVKLEDYSLA